MATEKPREVHMWGGYVVRKIGTHLMNALSCQEEVEVIFLWFKAPLPIPPKSIWEGKDTFGSRKLFSKT